MLPLAWRMNWKLALLMIALMASFAVFNTIAIQAHQREQGEVEQLHHEISERAGDVLGNVLVVQSFTRVAAEVAEIRAMMKRVLAAQYPVLRGWAWLSVANRAASTLTIVAIFALGAALNSRGEVSVGAIVSFVGFAMMLVGRLEQLANFISGLFFQTPVAAQLLPGAGCACGARGLGRPAARCRRSRAKCAFEDVSLRLRRRPAGASAT